jgi:hypothetical protein
MFHAAFDTTDSMVSLPANADLNPPERVDSADSGGGWYSVRLNPRLKRLEHGKLTSSFDLLFHVLGDVAGYPFPLVDAQRRLTLALPGWEIHLAQTDDRTGLEAGLQLVGHAIPLQGPIEVDGAERLRRHLYCLLSFVANREIGIGPFVGRDEKGEIVWVQWDAPRARPGRPGVRWCPSPLVTEALPVLAEGLRMIALDPAMLEIVDRSVGHLLAAGGGEVLDVRIPIACSGLELLAWAILQREEWLTTDGLGKLPKSGLLRLLLQWAGIPTALPSHFSALEARAKEFDQAGGPEVVFNVRNALVHPPKRLDDPEWPDRGVLMEAWQLTTWYLELALLRVFNYNGEYWSRLRLGRLESDTEPVPWAQG